MTKSGPDQPNVRHAAQDLPRGDGASQMKPVVNQPERITVPVEVYHELLEAAGCPRTCRVWHDDICSCGKERIRERARAFLK